MNTDNDITQARILVVDDEPINLILMEEILDEDGFNNVIYLDDPVKAIENYRTETIDLILLDLKMPVMNGYEFIQEIHGLTKKAPPILVLTASADNETHDKVLNANAQGIISKPFDIDEVLTEIKKMITEYWATDN